MSLEQFPTTAPVDSESYQKLLLYAGRKTGADSETLRDILWLIVAPGHLLALQKVVAMLLEILDNAPKSWEGALEESGVAGWRKTLEWLRDNRKKLEQEVGNHLGRECNTTGRNPAQGSCVSHYPMYSALCEILPEDAAGRVNATLLAGQLLLAHVVAMRNHSSRDEYETTAADAEEWKPLPNSADTPARAVRKFISSELVGTIPQTDASPEVFAEELENVSKELEDADRIYYDALWHFLQKSWGLIEWKKGTGGGGGGGGGHRWIGGRMRVGLGQTVDDVSRSDDDDELLNRGRSYIVRSSRSSAGLLKTMLGSDLNPEEDDEDEEILFSDFECGETKRDAGGLASAARAKKRHVAKNNQLFPWDYDALAMEETILLLNLAGDRFREFNKAKTLGENRDEVEILTLIHVMLWTNSDSERAASIYVCCEGSKANAALSIILPANSASKTLLWRVRALQPDYRTDINGDPSQLRGRAEAVELPELVGLMPYIIALLVGREGNASQRLFVTPAKELRKRLKVWLKRHFPDGRITVTKIGNTLWHLLRQEMGDPVLASCAVGVQHPLARVRLFYTTPEIALLQEGYARVVNRIVDLGYQMLGKERKHPEWHPAANGECVGARLCVTVAAAREMFMRLREDVRAAAEYTDRAGFIRYHNLYTLYVIQRFAYTTTCRAIKTPYLPASEVCRDREIASLADKGGQKARLVWIDPRLLEQMECYDEHVDALRMHLPQRHNRAADEPCFFLDESFRPVEASPTLIEKFLSPYLAVKANSHRRFLRTELVSRDCPPEVVDALMGHWYEGEEPFGKFSSFSVAEYIDQVRQHLGRLLDEIDCRHTLRGRLS